MLGCAHFGIRILPRRIDESVAPVEKGGTGGNIYADLITHAKLELIRKLGADPVLKELLKGSFIAFVIKGLSFGLFLVFTGIITHLYGARVFGTYSLAITILTILGMVSVLGLDTASMKLTSECSAQNRFDSVKEIYGKSLRLVVPVGVIFALILYFSSGVAADRIFHSSMLANYLKIFSLILLPYVLMLLNSENIRGLKQILTYTLVRKESLGLYVPAICGLLLLSRFSKRAIDPAIAFAIGVVFIFFAGLVLWLRRSNVLHVKSSRKITYRKIFHISLPLLFSSSLFMIMNWTDTIMIGIFSTDRQVGIYNVALRLGLIGTFALTSINTIAAPKFAEHKDDSDKLRKTVKQSTRIIFYSTAPLIVAYLLFPRFFLGLFGPEFRAGWIALILIAIGQFVNAISGSVGYFLQMTGRQHAFSMIIVAATVLNVVLNLFLIPPLGINGAALASLISVVLWNMTSVVYMKKKYGFSTLFTG